MIVRDCQNAKKYTDKRLQLNSDFSKTTSLITSETVAIELLVPSGWYRLKKLTFSFLHWISDGLEMPDLCVRWVQFDFGTRLSPNQLA